MKKWVITVAAFLILFTSSCNAPKETITIDVSNTAAALVEALSFEDELSEIDEGIVPMLYELPDTVVETAVYISSGATAEELSVFSFSEEKGAKEKEENIKLRIESQKESFENYIPDEVKRLEKAVIYRKGCDLIFGVSSDEDILTKIETEI